MDKLTALKEYFGHTQFRKGQEELIDNLLQGRDVLGVMPTGAGKSICYQLPAMMLPGISLIVSPLISLMHDQVSALRHAGINAAYINSSLSAAEYSKVLQNATNKAYKIIYIAPERLSVDNFMQFASQADISMVTVDEAHCISQWGQDFRPSYLDIRPFIDKLPKRPLVSAFTATATQEVRDDIINLLGQKDPYVITTGFNRENLYFEVRNTPDKYGAVQEIIAGNSGKSGIIYCATRKAVEQLTESLNEAKISAVRYHAGLDDSERKRNQEDFIYGRAQIIVATNAFGMGIDKPDVRFVVHYNMPKNLESYYQEAGRAGRDGDRAECVLLYSGQDVRINQFLIENSDSENKANDLELLKTMTFYSNTTDCLREYILKYFGEQTSGFCGNCSNCLTNFENVDITIDAQKIASCVYRIAQRNQGFGKNMVIEVLRGGKSDKLMRTGLNELPTYGIMADTTVKKMHSIINFMVEKGFLALSTGDYPILQLGPRAREILKDRIPLEIKMAKAKQKPKQSKKDYPEDPELFNALKALRTSLAKEASVPAYIVFADAALRDMCDKRPQSYDEFLDISGVGKSKADKYADAFINVISQYQKINLEG